MKIYGKIPGGFSLECTEQELYHLAGMDYPPPEGERELVLGDEISVVPVYQKIAAIEAHMAKVVDAKRALKGMVEELEASLEPLAYSAGPL